MIEGGSGPEMKQERSTIVKDCITKGFIYSSIYVRGVLHWDR